MSSPAINLSNVIWGVISVYVARKIYTYMNVQKEDDKTKYGAEPQTMKDTQVDVSGPSVVPRGPYVAN
jgi:hypothetical protein